MFDVPMVQRLAFDRDFYDLVLWLEDHKKEYVRFIMYGETRKPLENQRPAEPENGSVGRT